MEKCSRPLLLTSGGENGKTVDEFPLLRDFPRAQCGWSSLKWNTERGGGRGRDIGKPINGEWKRAIHFEITCILYNSVKSG